MTVPPLRLVAVLALLVAGVAYTWAAPQPRRPAARVARPVLHVASALASAQPPHGLSMPHDGPPVGANVEHGLAHRLPQYPAVFRATARQRAAAERLRRQLRTASERFSDPRVAEAAGFGITRPRRLHGERRVMWFHSENRRWHAARGAQLDPAHPDTLIYADLPGRPLKLVGVMISMPRGLRGPTPGGPITRWHYHLICVNGAKRGLAPRGDGSCPAGSQLRMGSEMMHVWFTRDLRSAYAVHAPWPELCAAQLLPADACAAGDRFVGM